MATDEVPDWALADHEADAWPTPDHDLRASSGIDRLHSFPSCGLARKAASGASVEPPKSSPIPCSVLPTTGTWIPSYFRI